MLQQGLQAQQECRILNRAEFANLNSSGMGEEDPTTNTSFSFNQLQSIKSLNGSSEQYQEFVKLLKRKINDTPLLFFHEDLPQSSCICFSSINYCTTTTYSFNSCQDFTHINKHRMIAVGSKGLPHNIFYAKRTFGTTVRVVCCDGGRGGG